MRLKNYFFVYFIFSVILLLTACDATDATGENSNTSSNDHQSEGENKEVIEMVANFFHPPSHHVTKNVIEPWVELVEEKTEGRIKVQLHLGGALGGSTTVLEDVKAGVYDVGGTMMPSYHYDTEIFPLSIGDLPFAFPDIESAHKVMTKFVEKHALDAFEEIVFMGITANDPYALNSTKPIESFEDMKDLRLRVTGTIAGELAKSWGSSPMSVSYEDVYDALQKGIVDANLFGPTAIISNSFYEVAPYLTKIDAYMTHNVPVMNRNFYNNLPDDIQKLFDEELNATFVELMTKTYVARTEEVNIDFAEKTENSVIELSTEELSKFKETVKPIWDQWVIDANDRGYPGDEMMNDFKEMLEEEGIDLPF